MHTKSVDTDKIPLTLKGVFFNFNTCQSLCAGVEKQDLPALEYVMQKRLTERTNVGIMMSGQGATADVWSATQSFLKERKRRAEAQLQASKQRAYSKVQEEARRAAAMALRKKSLFAAFGGLMEDMMMQMNQTVSGVPDDLVTVGKRKRSVKWDQAAQNMRAADGKDYYLVPPERALVPISARADYD